jgi:hypothetical protein
MKILRCGALFLAVCLYALPSEANLVQNPAFEANGAVTPGGTITSWTSVAGGAVNPGWGVGDFSVHSGSWAAYAGCFTTGCLDPVNGTIISQALATTSGNTYTLTFWYDSQVQGTTSSSGQNYTDLDVYWDGSLVASFPNEAPGYTQHTLTGLVATSSSTVLQFNGRNDPSYGFLDDVDVQPQETIPLLGGAGRTVLVLGLLALGLAVLRRHERVVAPPRE